MRALLVLGLCAAWTGLTASTGLEASAEPPGRDWRGDLCRADGDCRWDDPCKPTRCVGASGAAPATPGCEKPAPPPGRCACVEEMCTLQPRDPAWARSERACAGDASCAIDVAAGKCVVGGETLIGPIHQEGPVCTCPKLDGHCQLEWIEPVPCRTWRDCSWVEVPRLRPVSSKKVKRPIGRPVRACKDGEVDSVCTPQMTCRIVGWPC